MRLRDYIQRKMFIYGEREGERDYSLVLGTKNLDTCIYYSYVSISDSTRSQYIGGRNTVRFSLNLDI